MVPNRGKDGDVGLCLISVAGCLGKGFLPAEVTATRVFGH